MSLLTLYNDILYNDWGRFVEVVSREQLMPSNPNHRREFHRQPLSRRLSADLNYSKCNAEFDRIRITRSTAIDNISNFSLFLSPDFIPLHECPAGPAEFCKNRRLPGRGPRSCIRASGFLTKSSLPLVGERWVGKPFTLTNSDTILTEIGPAVDLSFPFTHFTRTCHSARCNGGRPALHPNSNNILHLQISFLWGACISLHDQKVRPAFSVKTRWSAERIRARHRTWRAGNGGNGVPALQKTQETPQNIAERLRPSGARVWQPTALLARTVQVPMP